MTGRSLSSLGAVFEGVFPTTLATCSREGAVNLIFVSQVHHVDEEHVAFSEQFLKRTFANLLENPRAQAWLVDPLSGAQYRLDLAYVRREQEGPLVSRMRAKLDGIASATGMSEIFRLRGAIVCRVLAVRDVLVSTNAPPMEPVARHRIGMASFGELATALGRAADLREVCAALLSGLSTWFGHPHSAVLLADETGRSLVTVDSHGFVESGIGSEIEVGHGLIGQCAATRQPVRVTTLSRDRLYARAVDPSARDIAPPSLSGAESLLAVPLVLKNRLIGVLAVESTERMAFGEEDEAALKLVAHLAASAIELAQSDPEPAPAPADATVRVRYYEEDDSVFVDDTYIVKGAAGRVLWVIVAHLKGGRADLTNRELRLDPRVALPALNDNLEARLLLLRRRLEERSRRLVVLSTGRGRLRVECDGRIETEVVPRGRR